MLCGIRASDNQKVFARDSEKLEGPFACPKCKYELVLKKGLIKVHHFAHKPPSSCLYGAGETEAHRSCKETIYLELKKLGFVTDLDVEANLVSVVADIYCKINNVPVAIEIQRSNLSVNEIITRTIKYERLGISVLWLALYNDKLKEERYSPNAWEKWCHAAYFGRVYYWHSGLNIVPVHYSEHKLYVDESSWYNEYGEEQSAGGYYRTSKRYKTPIAGNVLNLSSAFHPSYRPAWSGGTVQIPNCRIYLDKLPNWW